MPRPRLIHRSLRTTLRFRIPRITNRLPTSRILQLFTKISFRERGIGQDDQCQRRICQVLKILRAVRVLLALCICSSAPADEMTQTREEARGGTIMALFAFLHFSQYPVPQSHWQGGSIIWQEDY